MIAVIGYMMNEPVIRRVKIFMPEPLMYIIKSVMKILENPEVAADQAF